MFGRKRAGFPLKKLHRRPVLYVTRRDAETGKSLILGREGAINVLDGQVFVVCGGKDVFRAPEKTVLASELMSRDGVILRGEDVLCGLTEVTVFYAEGFKGK